MWLAPAFLAGLLTVGLPLWLHRFARQTQEKQPFASLMLIEAGDIRRSRAHELRYWLLLTLRVLLLALLALAFAGPLWRSVVPPGGTAGSTLHVIVVDTSLSMQAGGRWDAAKSAARRLVAGLAGNDRAMLVAADHRLRTLQEPVFAGQRGELEAALAQLAPGESRLDYGTVVTGASGWAPAPGERLLIHLVTDLQQSGSPLRFADLQPPPGAAVDLVDVGGADDRNLHVVSAGPAERAPRSLAVRIDGDREAVGTRELIVEVDGTERARRKLDPAQPLPRLETFDVGELGDGDHRILARLTPGDALAADDSFHAVLRQVAPRVLLVASSPTGTDTAYLRAALQALATPVFRVETSAPGAAATRTLAEFAAVIVSDAGILDTRAADALRRYVEGGGAVLMTLGPRSQRLERLPIGQQTLAAGRRRAQGNEAARVGSVDDIHPVLRESAGWRQVRFFRHVPVEPREGESVLLRFENGSPLLLEQRIGQGRLLTLTSPLDRDWNDLAIHPLFVRFIAEATGYLTGDTGIARTATVGTTTTIELGGRAGAQVFDPAGRRASMLGGSAEDRRLAPDQTGFYELRGGGRSEWIAVNADPRESALGRLPSEAVEQWRGLRAQPEPSAPGAVSPGGVDARTRLLPVWLWLLVAAALLAFAEPLVANYHLYVRRERSA